MGGRSGVPPRGGRPRPSLSATRTRGTGGPSRGPRGARAVSGTTAGTLPAFRRRRTRSCGTPPPWPSPLLHGDRVAPLPVEQELVLHEAEVAARHVALRKDRGQVLDVPLPRDRLPVRREEVAVDVVGNVHESDPVEPRAGERGGRGRPRGPGRRGRSPPSSRARALRASSLSRCIFAATIARLMSRTFPATSSM